MLNVKLRNAYYNLLSECVVETVELALEEAWVEEDCVMVEITGPDVNETWSFDFVKLEFVKEMK